MEREAVGERCPARGRRYSPAERVEILKDASVLGVGEAAAKHGCAEWTIYDWQKKQKRSRLSG